MTATVAEPARFAHLAHDARGYPVPWNVVIDDNGRPVFTANDTRKHLLAIRDDLCPICGQPNDDVKYFVGGPQSAFHEHGWYFDLPGHLECMQFALQVCPYLAARNYAHRIDIPKSANLPAHTILIDGTSDPRRPKVFVAVGCRDIEIQAPRGLSLPYVRPKRPWVDSQYWKGGTQLSREEGRALVVESFAADGYALSFG